MDEWLRRKLRCILWRQWKKPRTRARKLMERGIEKARAYTSAYNGRGPWWNAGASHMNFAISVKWLAQQGLLSLLDEQQTLTESYMNRRMPNGTYGGVRGWGREAPAYSIGVDNNQMLNSGKEGENQDFRKYFSTLRNCTVHLLL